MLTVFYEEIKNFILNGRDFYNENPKDLIKNNYRLIKKNVL